MLLPTLRSRFRHTMPTMDATCAFGGKKVLQRLLPNCVLGDTRLRVCCLRGTGSIVHCPQHMTAADIC